MTDSRRAFLYQGFKYAVYALLTLNVFIFFVEEHAAAAVQFPAGIAPADLINAYASTIDTTAWVVLLLMFELETYVLDERHFTPLVTRALRMVRAACYLFVLYAFYGYVANLLFVQDSAVFPLVDGICGLASGDWAYAVDLDEYTAISASNCGQLGSGGELYRFGTLNAVVDVPGLIDIQRLAWADAINSATWVLVLIVLEFDVWLQERGRYEGPLLVGSNRIKFVLYGILFTAAVYWGVKGDFVDFWDAFLWLVAFFFIEMNVIEWREEELAAAESGG